MRRTLALLLLLLAACGRPLTPHEADLAQRLFGESLDPVPVRLHDTSLVGLTEHRFATRPRTTCRERLGPPPTAPYETGRIAGVALGNHLHIRPDVFRPDFARRADGALPLAAAMFLAHELTHVWQWQNRRLTGYSPLRVGAEHRPGVDPYLFDPATNAHFLDYGYEQQASLVEEYVCCMALDPDGARTTRLHTLLSQVMEPRDLPRGPISLPWNGAETRGICG
ncbi:MAG: hypothetical protein H6899_03505 [Rhodobacter sp.]|nr:hypothetical protein [Paracoccaceae bacterium]MCB1408139.1 hypothetical protein [Paracoccaceae bacterium]MCC0079022.1 hypothetical protein [Rhodobacter sp.]